MEIRQAREAELHELLQIQLHALGLEDLLQTFQPGEVPALYHHGYRNGETLVAQEGGSLVGFSVGYERDGTWFLGEFFVLPGVQEKGTGQALLKAAMPVHGQWATVSTSDYRAQALYTRFGMTPRWPSFTLRADLGRLQAPIVGGYSLDETGLDQELARWDAEISGRARPVDLSFLCEGWNGSLYWIERHNQRVGYAGISRRSPDRVSIGPVGVRDAVDAVGAVMAVVDRARNIDGVESISIDLSGPHPALRALLQNGFRVLDQNMFCASAPDRFGDPARYLPLIPAIY